MFSFNFLHFLSIFNISSVNNEWTNLFSMDKIYSLNISRMDVYASRPVKTLRINSSDETAEWDYYSADKKTEVVYHDSIIYATDIGNLIEFSYMTIRDITTFSSLFDIEYVRKSDTELKFTMANSEIRNCHIAPRAASQSTASIYLKS